MTKLNPWLQEALKGRDPRGIRVIIEVDPRYVKEAVSMLRRMGVRVDDTAFDMFIFAKVPDVATLEAIEKLPFVKEIHYDMPKSIYPTWLPPLPTLEIRDELAGVIRVSRIEVEMFKPPTPFVGFSNPLMPKIKRGDIEVIPSSETVPMVRDMPTMLSGRGVRVAVLDTGATPGHPQLVGKYVKLHSTTGEPPFDGLGHGMWVATLILGRRYHTRFGIVESVAPAADLVSVKCLSNLGFGSSSSVIKAMELALYSGAKVVNMSLGGPLQGGVDHDPECKVVKMLAEHGVIVVVAAGNEGPGEWTISSPGACPHSLTIGAWSPMYDDIAYYSSRGPNAQWYMTHRDQWNEDLEKYGDLIIKPDAWAPGGGPAKYGQKPIDMIYSGVTGWMDGLYDLLADGFEPMRGTSMATPHAAGLVALLVEADPMATVDKIKDVLRRTAEEREKSHVYGWGPIKLSRFATA